MAQIVPAKTGYGTLARCRAPLSRCRVGAWVKYPPSYYPLPPRHRGMGLIDWRDFPVHSATVAADRAGSLVNVRPVNGGRRSYEVRCHAALCGARGTAARRRTVIFTVAPADGTVRQRHIDGPQCCDNAPGTVAGAQKSGCDGFRSRRRRRTAWREICSWYDGILRHVRVEKFRLDERPDIRGAVPAQSQHDVGLRQPSPGRDRWLHGYQ